MVRLFNRDKDYGTVARWWFEHGQIPCAVHLLPNIGFIVDDLVVGFLYQTDSGIVHFESIVSKKDSNKEKRKEALEEIINASVQTAKEMGYKQLVFHTIYPHLKELGISKFNCKPFEGSTERFYKELK